MKTKEQIEQLLKDKLYVNNNHIAKLLKLKNTIYVDIPGLIKLRLMLLAVSYEKETDTVWLLGKSSVGIFTKATIHEILSESKIAYKELDELTDHLQDLPIQLIDLPPQTDIN